MSKKNDNIKGPIISAALGAMFFAVPYLGLSLSLLPSLGIGIAAFGAGNMLLSDSNKSIEGLVNPEVDFKNMITLAKKQNAEIYGIINKLEDEEIRKNITELHETASKIIETVEKNPKKVDKVGTFFSYYLPVTLKILLNYDNIENQKLNNEESEKFMKSAERMVDKINKSFKVQLANLYQSDMIDTDAEIKVFESMLKSEGIDDINDFNIK